MRVRIPHAQTMFLYAIVLFFLCTPPFFDYIGIKAISLVLDLGSILVYLWIALKWICKGRISAIMILAILMFGSIVVSTITNGGELPRVLLYVNRYLIVIFLVSNEKSKIDVFFRGCVVYLTFCAFVNFVSILLFPDGMNARFSIVGQPYWFLSNKNGLGKVLLVWLFFKADCDYRFHGHLTRSFFLIAAVALASVILVWSAASMVVIALMISIVVCSPYIHKTRPRLFNIYYFLLAIVILFLLFVIVQNTGVFSDFITKVLKKSLSFNGRTPIWKSAINRILDRPVLGYGYIPKSEFIELIGRKAAADAHNYLLTLGVYGGFIPMVLFIGIVLLVAKRVHKIQFEYEGIAITAFVFSFLVLLIFENTSNNLFWIIFTYAACIRKKESGLMDRWIAPHYVGSECM